MAPAHGDGSNIAVAHDTLSKDVNAMLIVDSVKVPLRLRRVGKVVIWIHIPIEPFEAVKLMVDSELTVISAIRQRHGVLDAITRGINPGEFFVPDTEV